MPSDAPRPPTGPVRGHPSAGKSPDVVRIGRAARTWRLATAIAALVVLLVAQVVPRSHVNTNDWFPLGSLSQYAFAPNPDSAVQSAHVIGVTAGGDEVDVRLGQTGIGVEHSEIEGQQGRIEAHPALLRGVLRAYVRRYPDRPPFVEIRLEQTTAQLKDGQPTGTPTTTVLATWKVPGAAGSADDGAGS